MALDHGKSGGVAGAGFGQAALLIDALSFVIVMGAALSLKARRHPTSSRTEPVGESDRGRGRDGLDFMARDRTLAPTLAVGLGTLLFFSISMTAELFFAKDVLRAGDAGYGLLLTGWTVGMVAGASLLARRVPSGLLASGALAAECRSTRVLASACDRRLNPKPSSKTCTPQSSHVVSGRCA